ncbi:hypothetical protein ISCGN_012954 [Ixodes scapularis]
MPDDVLSKECWMLHSSHASLDNGAKRSHHSTTAAVVSSATKPSSALALFREPAHNSPTGFLFADDVASTGAAQPPSSRALVCVLSPAAIHLDRFPAHLCSYLVFTRRLDAEQATPPDVLPLSGSRFASFLKLCARTRTPAVVATVPSALSGLFAGGALSEAPARRLSVSLLKAGLGGMAVFAAPDEDLALLDQYLEGMSSYYRRRASPLRLLAGVHYRQFDPAILKRLVSHVDLLVFFTHPTLHGEKCTVVSPSSELPKYKDLINFLISQAPARHNAAVCLSVNLAVFGFETKSSRAVIGDSCISTRLETYARTCRSESTMTLSDANWVTSYRRNSSWIQIFEDEDTIAKKMTAYLNAVPGGCAAAVNADLEDSRGKCPGRRAYSRLKNLAGLLEKCRTKDKETRPSLGTRNTLVCFVEPSAEVLSDFPSDACDYVVLSRQKFHSVEAISSILDAWQSLLPAQRTNTPLAIEVNSHTLVSTYTNDVKAGALLIESVPGWLERNDVQGVAVLIGGLSARQELLMYSILKDLKDSLSSSTGQPFQLIIAVASGSELFHAELVQLADVFVYADYHMPNNDGSCKIQFPSVSSQTASLTSSLLRTKELMEKGSGNKTFCVTLNLAVLKFNASPERLSLGAQCGAESLAGYSEVCSLPSSRTVFDMNWMSASLRSGDVLYTFEKEGVLLSKVLFLKTLHPSLCVAAFHTELDSTSCTQPFARLVDIRTALDSAVHGEGATVRAQPVDV